MRLHCPYIPLHVSHDPEGNARRQREAARINEQTNRVLDTREVVNRTVDVLRRVDKTNT